MPRARDSLYIEIDRRTLAGLQAKLQQAEEEGDRWKADALRCALGTEAAIERGVALCQEYLAQVGFGRVLAAVRLRRAEAAEQDLKDALEIKAHWKADADEQRALVEHNEHKLILLKIKCEEYIADCCAENEERFCDNYGCGTLRDFLDIIKALPRPAEAQEEGDR